MDRKKNKILEHDTTPPTLFDNHLVAENSKIIQLPLTHGANINAQNHQGDTPLMSLLKSAHKAYKKEALLACLAFRWSNVDFSLANQTGETIQSLAKQHHINLAPYIGHLTHESGNMMPEWAPIASTSLLGNNPSILMSSPVRLDESDDVLKNDNQEIRQP